MSKYLPEQCFTVTCQTVDKSSVFSLTHCSALMQMMHDDIIRANKENN